MMLVKGKDRILGRYCFKLGNLDFIEQVMGVKDGF